MNQLLNSGVSMYFAYPNFAWAVYIGLMSLVVLRRRENRLNFYVGGLGLLLGLGGLFIPTSFIINFSRLYFP